MIVYLNTCRDSYLWSLTKKAAEDGSAAFEKFCVFTSMHHFSAARHTTQRNAILRLAAANMTEQIEYIVISFSFLNVNTARL
jgi:hypothetical protein